MGPVTQGGQLSQNHWTIYMLTATGSVQLNMQADAVSDRGKLVVKEHAYITSNTAVQYWDVPAYPNVSAGDVYSLILTKGRDRYNMTEGGVGCRWWCKFISASQRSSRIGLTITGFLSCGILPQVNLRRETG
jgi:hypothetical protein